MAKMIELYQFEECPYCQMVRQWLSDHKISYIIHSVPHERSQRKEVIKVSGQPLVPVLVDGDVVLDDENEIIAYLEKKYGKKK